MYFNVVLNIKNLYKCLLLLLAICTVWMGVSLGCFVIPADEVDSYPVRNSKQKHGTLNVTIGILFCWHSECGALPERSCLKEKEVAVEDGQGIFLLCYIVESPLSCRKH